MRESPFACTHERDKKNKFNLFFRLISIEQKANRHKIVHIPETKGTRHLNVCLHLIKFKNRNQMG